MAIQGNSVLTMSAFDEMLASFPEVPRKTSAGDGVVSPGTEIATQASASKGPDKDQEEENGSELAPVGPTLVEAPPQLKYQAVEQLVRSQDRLAKNRWAIDLHYRSVRAGVPFSRLDKIPNMSMWVRKLPNGMNKESTASVPNKADDLCNKIEDTLMSDPAKPIAEPHVEDEAAQRAAELLGQFLMQISGESGIKDIENYRWMIRNSLAGSSSFLHYDVDRSGGGYQPLQKLAHPKAEQYDEEHPTWYLDPMTGQVDVTPNPILRYVAPDGVTFVESAEEADKVWLPSISVEQFRREGVRCFPPTARVEDAEAVVLIRHCTLGTARKRWPKTAGRMSGEELQALAGWRPPMAENILPYSIKGGMADGASGPGVDEVGSLSPLLQRRMFAYRLYVAASPEYPTGYWCDLNPANGGTVLAEGTLEYTVKLPVHGKTTRCRDIPVVQYTPQVDTEGSDPMGWPVISRFAGASDAEATLLSAFMDYCDNMLHPHVYIRSTASVDEDEWYDRTKPVVLHPSDPEPTYENFPILPPILQLVQALDTKMDTASGLTATAQGLESTSSETGVAKQLTIRQAQVSMSGFLQRLHAAQTRGWRISGQIAMAEYTTPQMMQFAGEEGSNEPIWWTGEDLAGVDRIGVQPGTGTMMTAESRATYVAYLQQNQWLAPEAAADIALPSIRMDLGIPKDPYEAAVNRSVAALLQGPPDGWVEAKKQEMAVMQQYQASIAPLQMQAQAGVAVQIPPPPQSQLTNPFPVRPNDDEPRTAAIYVKRLSALFVDPKFAALPPEWAGTAVEAYFRYRQAVQASTAATQASPEGQGAHGAAAAGGSAGGGGAASQTVNPKGPGLT